MVETKGVHLFIEDLKRECKRRKVKIIFGKGRTVKIEDSLRSSGYFDPAHKELVVGKNRPDWLSILVHESCHMDQWVQDCKVWRRDDRLGTGQLDEWLLGENMRKRRVAAAIHNIIRLELDCERRALVKIAEYNLPINTTWYSRKANSYLFYYLRVLETRKWKPAVYDSPTIINTMPDKLMHNEYYDQLPTHLRKYFIAAGF